MCGKATFGSWRRSRSPGWVDSLLLEPNPQEYTERGRFEQPNRTTKPAWAHPVIANGRLYIRDHDLLLCYDVKRPSGS